MEGYYYGYPSRNNSFYPYSNPNPNRYMNPYQHANSNPNHILNPYHNSNSQPNQYRNPYHNSNPNPYHFLNPYHNSNSQPNQYRNPYHNIPNPSPNHASEPRVVSIPIQFVNSDPVATQPPTQSSAPTAPRQPSPEVAAVKLQKVIRGFLVRKNWRIVRKIEAEAEAIGEEIARDEKLLEKEVKAQIRVGEMLMNILFRLDSVRGVRDYRKKVIRKVISLQELVDSIGARGDKVQSDTIEVERSDSEVDSVESTAQNPNSYQIEESKVVEAGDSIEEAPVDTAHSIDTNEGTENMVVATVDSMKESPIELVNPTETLQSEKLREEPNVYEDFTEAQESDEVCDPTETLEMDESVRRLNSVDQASESSQVVRCNGENNGMEMKGVRDVMERVVVESERMKILMEELCKSSARQWRLMEGLVDRVQRLEKEVAKKERRGKKKRKGHGRKCDSCNKKCDNL